MSITEELRAYVKTNGTDWGMNNHVQCILTIADRIDKEHAEAVADALQLRGEPDRWVELPVDADGVPIRVGDRMAFEDGEEFDVIGVGNSTLFYVDDDFADAAAWTQACNKRHVKPDSWEGIITDALKFAGNGGIPTGARFADYAEEFVERCRRLAGDVE